jgi:Sulfotransferase domain
MALKVIGAGLGRTGTLSLKLAFEHLGFGPCYHMTEAMAGMRRNVPLWLQVISGRPDWPAVFDGFASTTDYPACTYWRELADFYTDAKIVLSVRDPDSWFDSVSRTIFDPEILSAFDAGPMKAFMQGTVTGVFGDQIRDRAFMTDWYRHREASVIAAVPPGRLLVHRSRDGWGPLCTFLGVAEPAEPYPQVNSTADMQASQRPVEPPPPEMLEQLGRDFIEAARAKAFGP